MEKQVLLYDGRSSMEALEDPKPATLTDEHAQALVLMIDGIAYAPGERTAAGNRLLIADAHCLRRALDSEGQVPVEPAHIQEWNRLVVAAHPRH